MALPNGDGVERQGATAQHALFCPLPGFNGNLCSKENVLTHQKFEFHPEIRDLGVSENDGARFAAHLKREHGDKPFFESNQFLHRQTTEYSVFHSESSILSTMGSRCWPQC